MPHRPNDKSLSQLIAQREKPSKFDSRPKRRQIVVQVVGDAAQISERIAVVFNPTPRQVIKTRGRV
ncbi:hypothetical protein Taro_025508 [Colocasia esculenta]|uniref:Uncharacterized protein n=1 Tax=Colocasia esculenta TaxID=4460 RepID=A0A843V3H0_COLES|nr:hypothetical protein [Colocasia esculenta]